MYKYIITVGHWLPWPHLLPWSSIILIIGTTIFPGNIVNTEHEICNICILRHHDHVT